MSLKSIRESYAKLLTVFEDTGIKLTESQKDDMDSFIMSLEESMSEQRKDAIEKAKKATTIKLEKEYAQLFESIMDNAAKNTELETKIRAKQAAIDETNKLADKVSDYLDLYVESILPKKTIVDYERMHKLETIHESLKNSLLMSEDDVVDTKQKLEESFDKQKGKLETEVAKIQAKLNESIENNKKMQKKLDHYKAMDILESKTADLPAFEANKVKKMLSESSAADVEKRFDETLAKVKNETKKMCAVSEKTLNEEIDRIVNDESEDVDEDDIGVKLHMNGFARANGPFHNGDIQETEDVEENDILAAGHTLRDNKGPTHAGNVKDTSSDKRYTDESEFETMEEVELDENGDPLLSEEDVIDESTMNYYCNLAK